MSLKQQIDLNKLPGHVAIIMDGNGRWAKKKGRLRTYGHHNGVTAVRETAEAAAELGVSYLTLYAFSTENWKRPRLEVETLMHLLLNTIKKELETLKKNNIRLNAIGDLSSLPLVTYEKLQHAIEQTSSHDGMTLTLALSYSARWELMEAVRKICRDMTEGKFREKELDQQVMQSYLTTHDMPDVELLIRTSGEYRISNFMLWQIAYAELYFTPTLWPDFRKKDFYRAIYDFQNRERRFGLTSEQLKIE